MKASIRLRCAATAIVVGTVVLSFSGSATAAARGEERSPNVLVIMSDDHRADVMGVAGDALVLTPSLDRLASEGTRFTNFASQSPKCVPSRASIQSGWYQSLHGVKSGIQMNLPTPYLAEVFVEGGYTTGYAGKWHLNGSRVQAVKEDSYVPPDARAGYQEWDAYDTGTDHDRPTTFDESQDPPVLVEVEGYDWTPSYYSDVFLDFAARHAGDEAPWMYYLSYALPHQPEEAPEAYLDLFPPEGFDLYGFAPGLEGEISENLEQTFREQLQIYYAQVSFLDSEIGLVLDGLDALGLSEDTLVIYLSDHGQLLGSHYFEALDLGVGTGDPFRAKEVPFSTVIRAPLIMRWPGHIPAASEVDALMSMVDFSPTLLDLAGLEVPFTMQGVSLREWCLGGVGVDQEALYLSSEGNSIDWEAVWTGNYIYSSSEDIPILYDQTVDPLELNNLFDDPAYEDVRLELQGFVDELSVYALTIPEESDPEPTEGSSSSDTCFIATAAYGTPLAAELDTLRAFRDRYLITNAAGGAFVDAYYRLSPPVAEWIAVRAQARLGIRTVLGMLIVVGEHVSFFLVLSVGAGCVGARRLRVGRNRAR